MEDIGVKIIVLTSMNPIFKGLVTLLVGVAALLFVYFLKKKFNEPDNIGLRIFIGLSVFIIIYRLFILLVRPEWWLPPYPVDLSITP